MALCSNILMITSIRQCLFGVGIGRNAIPLISEMHKKACYSEMARNAEKFILNTNSKPSVGFQNTPLFWFP